MARVLIGINSATRCSYMLHSKLFPNNNRLIYKGVKVLKIIKYLIVFIGIFSIIIAGCSNESTNESSNGVKIERTEIIVQKRVGEENKYEQHNKITDNATVINVMDILSNISWENAKVDMVHPPDYKFNFENKDEQSKSNKLYDLWISPNKDKIELVIERKSKYAQLDKDNSAELFEILTGVKLSDLK